MARTRVTVRSRRRRTRRGGGLLSGLLLLGAVAGAVATPRRLPSRWGKTPR